MLEEFIFRAFNWACCYRAEGKKKKSHACMAEKLICHSDEKESYKSIKERDFGGDGSRGDAALCSGEEEEKFEIIM